jgi:hypothetical protein
VRRPICAACGTRTEAHDTGWICNRCGSEWELAHYPAYDPSRRPPFDRCGYVKRDAEFCGTRSVVVFAYAEKGIGACPGHVWQVMRFCQDGDQDARRYEQGDRSVVAVPTWRWEEYEEQHQQ